jgi:DNA-binding transcriptional MerR regulator
VYEDFDAILTAPMAAARVGVTRQLLNYWRSSGLLPVAERRAGRPLYRLGDLLKAEAEARRSARWPRRTAVNA